MQPTAARRATRAIRAGLTRDTAPCGEVPSSTGPTDLRAHTSAVVPLALAAAFLALPVSLPAQVLTGPTTPARPPPSAWPELPQGGVCPSTPASLPGRGNFLSIRKFSPVGTLVGCSALWNDDLHRHFFRGSPPSRRGLECLGTSFGVTHLIDLRRPDEIQADSSMGGFRTEEQIVGEYNQRHPDHPMRYFNVRTTRETPEENERQIQNVARYVEQALIEDPAAVFYLHCRAGRDRTGVMVAAIESLVGGCPWPEVRRELFAYRFTRNYTRALLLPLRHALGLDP